MPIIRRTTKIKGETDKVDTFTLPALNSRVIGAGVNNHVIYNLKKRKRATAVMNETLTYEFEVVG